MKGDGYTGAIVEGCPGQDASSLENALFITATETALPTSLQKELFPKYYSIAFVASLGYR